MFCKFSYLLQPQPPHQDPQEPLHQLPPQLGAATILPNSSCVSSICTSTHSFFKSLITFSISGFVLNAIFIYLTYKILLYHLDNKKKIQKINKFLKLFFYQTNDVKNARKNRLKKSCFCRKI